MVRSMYSGVTGLKIHQTRMDVIGNNIANVNTYGFKSSRAVFSDIYYQTLTGASAGRAGAQGGVNPSAVGYGSSLSAIQLMMTQSAVTNTGFGMDAAISGDGFFRVQDSEGRMYYTKAGMFDIDSGGNLVDVNGNFVVGRQSSEEGYFKSGDDIIVAPVGFDFSQYLDAAGTAIDNDKAQSMYEDLCETISSLGLVKEGDDTTMTDLKAAIDGLFTIDANGKVTATSITMAGASTEVMGAIEGVVDISNTNKWLIDASGKDTPDGALGADNTVTYTDRLEAAMKIYNDAVDTVTQNDRVQIANYQGRNITGISIGSDGLITATESRKGLDGDQYECRVILGQMSLATFVNPKGLAQSGNSYYTETANSGKPQVTDPGKNGSGALKGSSLELSNVDLSQEFADMITTQRGFQANSRIITVSDTMLEELINLKR